MEPRGQDLVSIEGGQPQVSSLAGEVGLPQPPKDHVKQRIIHIPELSHNVATIVMLREIARAIKSRNFTSLNNTGCPEGKTLRNGLLALAEPQRDTGTAARQALAKEPYSPEVTERTSAAIDALRAKPRRMAGQDSPTS